MASIAAAADFQYTLIGRTDARVRSNPGGAMPVTGELEVLPSGEGVLGLGPTRLNLLYGPSILFLEPQLGGQVLVLHRGRLGVATHWEGGTFSLTEDGAYGETDVNPLRNPEAATTTTTLANAQTGSVLESHIIPYARSVTSANLDLTLQGRVVLGFSAGYQLGGSLANDAGVTDPLPFQYGPTGAVRVRVGVTDLDSVTATAQIMEAKFVYGGEQLLAQALGTWDRQVSRTVTTSVTAGAAFARQHVCTIFTDPDAGTPRADPVRYCELPTPAPANWDTTLTTPGWYMNFFPVVSASASWRGSVGQGSPMILGALVRLAPFADYNTGAVYERLEGRVQGDWSASRTILLRLIGAAAYGVRVGGLGNQAGDQQYSGEATLTWTPEQWFSIMASARIIWAAQPLLGNSGRVDWAGTVSAILRTQDTVGW